MDHTVQLPGRMQALPGCRRGVGRAGLLSRPGFLPSPGKRCRTRSRRKAFTLIELLVVVTLVLLLVGLLLPTVQQARGAAARTACANNLRQLGLALCEEESARGGFPPGSVTRPRIHGWVPYVLSYLDEDSLAKQYHWEVSWDSEPNDPVVTAGLPVIVCPAAPTGRAGYTRPGLGLPRAVGDYSAINDVATDLSQLSQGVPADPDGLGVLRRNLRTPVSEITDGTSNTLMVTESAGRPQLWHTGRLVKGGKAPNSAWANPQRQIRLTGSTPDGLSTPGPCALNCTNDGEVYSFHPGGANGLFADGSVRFLHAGMSLNILAALVSRAGGETTSPEDY
jgi:prepilin-type processing-associated H-X9-DG protein/prepilin-type N-terminal cleavage/methylation domain-containing protein